MTKQRAQYEADQLRISELEAQNKALQAKITQFAGIIMDYETKFDVIAENEGERMVEFGTHVRLRSLQQAYTAGINNTELEELDLKQLYTNFKRK